MCVCVYACVEGDLGCYLNWQAFQNWVGTWSDSWGQCCPPIFSGLSLLKKYYLFIFGHTGSLLPCLGFPHLWWPGATLLQCADFSLQRLLLLWSMVSRVPGLSSCGAWAQLPWGMWDPPGPGVELVSCSLVGILPTTEPPGKSSRFLL